MPDNFSQLNALTVAMNALAAEDYFSDIGLYREIDGGLFVPWGGTEDDAVGVINDGAFVVLRRIDVVEAANQEQHGPHFTGVPLTFRVFTNDHRNQTGKVNMDICEALVTTLHRNPLDEYAQDAIHDERPERLVEQGDGYCIRDCFLRCGCGVAITLPAIETPVISGTGTITLTCATPGAAIFYTTDGERSSPRHGTFYSAPFALASGQTVKASAWLAGHATSAEASYTRP